MSDQNDQSFAVPPPELPPEAARISQREPSAESRAEREGGGGLGDLRIRGAQEAVSAALLADAPRRKRRRRAAAR